ncbi:MAG: RraA family protein [Alphaproteobacteria bacterium]|nr:RraA family protein [Alphaproteobacteria bacterium]
MIEDPPLLTINRRIERPDPKLVAKFKGAQTGHIVDVLGGLGAMAAAIKPVEGAPPAMWPLCGPAYTCACYPGDHLALIGALAEAKPGDVIVAAIDNYLGTAVVGDLMMGIAKNRGLAGLVTDGAVRDVDGILEVGLPVFCAGVSPNSPAKTGPGAVGLTVILGGLAVSSGDVVVGDRNGIVVVPKARLSEVVDGLVRVRAVEDKAMKAVADGLTFPERWNALLDPARIRYLD